MHIICIYNIACRYSILFQVKSIETDDPIFLKQYLRMSPDKFNVLKVKLKPFIRKNPAGHPFCRPPIGINN